MAAKTPEFTFKILLLGDGGVGKTSLVNRFVQDKFTKEYLHTIGMQPSQKYLTINGKYICLSIFDIAGDKSFKRLREMFYRGAKGALLTYDLTEKASFENVKSWHKEAKSKAKDQLFVLIGNKNDLANRKVSAENGKKMAKELNCADFLETSALTGDYVDEAFKLLG
ncbi:MAG: Rab family GTPase, partial [Candidatus Kariarchaeaceae archaeon]